MLKLEVNLVSECICNFQTTNVFMKGDFQLNCNFFLGQSTGCNLPMNIKFVVTHLLFRSSEP